ncbi:MAG TPA: hypothetical protein VKO87_05870 [Gemmatimonadaceae bacterium]|nr:hypothetical protein [Gemmatimonadaceae bacterium]
MIGTLRSLALASVAVSIAALAACDETSSKTTGVLDEDSTLAREVMTARGDTLLAPPDSERIIVDRTPTRPIPVEPLTIENSHTTVATMNPPTPRPAQARRVESVKQPAREPSVVRTQETTIASATVTPPPVKRVREKPRAAEVSADAEPVRHTVRASGTVSAGSSLSLVAGQRVCTYAANPGDTFEAVLLESVRGSNGVEIPKGALAVAQITSVGEWGAGMGVRVKSVRFKGHTYPLSSDIGYVALERAKSKGAVCIPERGRIDASLTHPLTVVAYN